MVNRSGPQQPYSLQEQGLSPGLSERKKPRAPTVRTAVKETRAPGGKAGRTAPGLRVQVLKSDKSTLRC